jgi:hypothetical protein
VAVYLSRQPLKEGHHLIYRLGWPEPTERWQVGGGGALCPPS